MDNFALNRIDIKKLIGININKNMSIFLLAEKLKNSKINFSNEIKIILSISVLISKNFELFNNSLKLQNDINYLSNSLSLALNLYTKVNSNSLQILDTLPIVGNGAPIQSQIGTKLIPLSNSLIESKTAIDNLNKEIIDLQKTISLNIENINTKTDNIKEDIFNKIYSISKIQI
jgi:hypothetical protein